MKNIKKSVLTIPIMFEEQEVISTEDERFTKVKVFLMHTGKNINDSYFDKEVIEKAMPTLGYIPIVGFISEDKYSGDKDFNGHKYILVKDEKGLRRKYIGSAYGVILSNADNNAHFEMRMCDDGEEREFLVVDGIMWNMFEDSTDIMARDIVKSQSMELYEDSVEGYEDENGDYHFTSFSFRAACILGDNVSPAMHNATVEVEFAVADFIDEMQSELNDKFTAFTAMVNKQKNDEGGKENMPKSDFSQTVMELFSDIANIVSQAEIVRDRWGDDVSRYYLMDIQDDEVIVCDRMDNYNIYGFSFTMDGDKPVIDFKCGNRKKTRYENYEDGENPDENANGKFTFGTHIQEIETACFEKVSKVEEKVTSIEAELNTANENLTQAQTNYSDIKAQYDEILPKYTEYEQAENARREKEIEEAKDAKIAQFEAVLGSDAEFATIKENKNNMSADEIESKCAILFTKKNLANFSVDNKKNGVVTTGLMDDGDNAKGFVETKYGMIAVSK